MTNVATDNDSSNIEPTDAEAWWKALGYTPDGHHVHPILPWADFGGDYDRDELVKMATGKISVPQTDDTAADVAIVWDTATQLVDYAIRGREAAEAIAEATDRAIEAAARNDQAEVVSALKDSYSAESEWGDEPETQRVAAALGYERVGHWGDWERVEVPGFNVEDLEALEPGWYRASDLNPPGGDDCTHLLVRKDGKLAWCDSNGHSEWPEGFTAAELCDDGEPDEDDVERAAQHIGATELSDGRWAHYADETSRWYIVTASELAELCEYLDSDDKAVSGDAYSHWCAGTSAEEMPEGWAPGDEVD